MSEATSGEHARGTVMEAPTWEEREAIVAERTERLVALPHYTLVRVGLRPPSGQVQGQIYYRIGDGLGPTGRDATPADNLRREVTSWIVHVWPWGIDILAEPVPSCGDAPAPSGEGPTP